MFYTFVDVVIDSNVWIAVGEELGGDARYVK